MLGTDALAGLKEQIDSIREAGASASATLSDAIKSLQEKYSSKGPTASSSEISGIPDNLADKDPLAVVREACDKMGVPFMLPDPHHRASLGVPVADEVSKTDLDDNCNADDAVTQELILNVSTINCCFIGFQDQRFGSSIETQTANCAVLLRRVLTCSLTCTPRT